MTKIKDCPFCGGKAEIDDVYNEHSDMQFWKVSCNDCWASTYQQITKVGAIEQWNKRI
jgi:Lar family restriction alleviation protein